MHFGQRTNLIVDSLLSFILFKIFLVISFQSNRCFSVSMDSSPDLSEGTLPNFQSNLELFQLERLVLFLVLTTFVDNLTKSHHLLF